MKSILYTLAGLVLISSCSIAKRQYNSGFAIDFNSRKNQPIQVETITKKNNVPAEKATLAVAGKEEKNNFSQIELSNVQSENKTISLQLNQGKEAKKTNTVKENITNKLAKKAIKVAAKKINNSSFVPAKIKTKMNEAAGQMEDRGCIVSVLIFLCCLFIAPLGYFLSTGELDTKFWICLLCFILGGGLAYTAGYAFGLLALIAVIIALIAFFS